MMKKVITAGILVMLLMIFPYTVWAKEYVKGYENSGQMEITYTPDKRPTMLEIDKGSGVHTASAKTGDSTVWVGLEILVIASAILLMLIIYIKKRRNRL